MMSERNLNIEKKDIYFGKRRRKIFRQLLKFIRKFTKKRKKGSLYVGWLPGYIRQLIQPKLH